jgi:hypothetical protein
MGDCWWLQEGTVRIQGSVRGRWRLVRQGDAAFAPSPRQAAARSGESSGEAAQQATPCEVRGGGEGVGSE